MLSIGGKSVSSTSTHDSDLSTPDHTSGNISNLSYADFLVHQKEIMDSLQRAFFGASATSSSSSSSASAASIDSTRGEDIFDIMLPAVRGQFADDVAANRNFSSSSVLFTELTDDLSDGNSIDNIFNVGNMTNEEYQQFLADLWVGIVLTLMVLSCVCCMCSCLLYHKFQQWKRTVLETRAHNSNNLEAGGDNESLPSYTIASGLPSYEEALEQLKKIKCSTTTQSVPVITAKEQGPNSVLTNSNSTNSTIAPVHNNNSGHNGDHTTPGAPPSMARLSVVDLFQIYKNTNSDMSKA